MAKSRRTKQAPSPPATDVVATSADVAALAARFAGAEFLAVDTEFMREQTYYSQLCLIQISDGSHASAIDPLAPGIDLQPLWDLLATESITKVFHAA
ncbi:MAG: hypothetical protein VX326_01895, partial [Pseudomonadota bacterium]|nr:hypothetical protein [Pseudomonadota bacterium]